MKKMALIMALAALVCWLPGQALATTTPFISISDLTDGNPTVTTVGTIYGYQTSLAAEYAKVTGTIAKDSLSAGTFGVELLECVGGPVSDFATLTIGSSYFSLGDGFQNVRDFTLTFYSDEATGFSTALQNFECNVNYCTLVENGTAQDVTSQLHGTTTGLTISLQSDVETSAVPIPPSALLLGSALLGLVGIGWRKRS